MTDLVEELNEMNEADASPQLTQLLGVRYSLAKLKIIRSMVNDWHLMMDFEGWPEDAPELRDFVQDNFCDLLEQAKKAATWRDFCLSYKYT